MAADPNEPECSLGNEIISLLGANRRFRLAEAGRSLLVFKPNRKSAEIRIADSREYLPAPLYDALEAWGLPMIAALSLRNLAIAAYRQGGFSLRETAAKFRLSAPTVDRIERRVRALTEAGAQVEADPANLLLLAQTGRLSLSAARALAADGIHRVSELRDFSFRDLMRMPNMGRCGASQIVTIAAEWGIEIKR